MAVRAVVYILLVVHAVGCDSMQQCSIVTSACVVRKCTQLFGQYMRQFCALQCGLPYVRYSVSRVRVCGVCVCSVGKCGRCT